MNPHDDDTDLLWAYANQGDDQAFATLVHRYADVVFHAARRKTGDPQLAEEIAQNVFAILARKAGTLGKESVLAGWLHRTTLYECSHALRKESTRKRTMDALAKQSKGSLETPAPPIEDLDDALAKLSQADQNVLLLRFYQGLSFREIGHRLGKSDDTSQKQTTRALQKLKRILGSSGSALSIAGLATAITAEFGHAAPSGLANALTQSAITTAPTLSRGALTLHTINVMTYGKLIQSSILLAVLTALPLGVQQAQIRAARTAVEISNVALADLPSPETPAETEIAQVNTPVVAARTLHTTDDWVHHAILDKDSNWASIVATLEELAKLSPDEQRTLLQELEHHPGMGKPKQKLINHVITSISKHSPEEALAHAMRLNRTDRMPQLLVTWARNNADDAMTWMLEHQASGKLIGTGLPDPDNAIEPWMLRRLSETIAEENLPKAIQFASCQEGENANAALRAIASTHLRRGETTPFLSLTESLTLSQVDRHAILVEVAASSVAQHGTHAADWLMANSLQINLPESLAKLMTHWSASNLETAQAWMGQLEPTLRDYALRGLAEGLVTEIPYTDRDGMDPTQARAMAMMIQDQALRQQTLQKIAAQHPTP